MTNIQVTATTTTTISSRRCTPTIPIPDSSQALNRTQRSSNHQTQQVAVKEIISFRYFDYHLTDVITRGTAPQKTRLSPGDGQIYRSSKLESHQWLWRAGKAELCQLQQISFFMILTASLLEVIDFFLWYDFADIDLGAQFFCSPTGVSYAARRRFSTWNGY